jgi:hypothetical protein
MWDRGHILMRRQDLVVYVTDEIAYDLGEVVDIRSILVRADFRWYGGPCPVCGSENFSIVRGLLVARDAYGTEEIRCLELGASEFERVEASWALTSAADTALRR